MSSTIIHFASKSYFICSHWDFCASFLSVLIMAAAPVMLFGIFALMCSIALAPDHSPLQDFCVADLEGPVLLNGRACRDPKLAQADDFFFSGSSVKPVNVVQIPGLNTLGLSML